MRNEYEFLRVPEDGAAGGRGLPALSAPVLDFGRPARDRLACSRRWTAIARFRRSTYLRSENGDIVCLCSPSIDPGPLNIRCALPEAFDWRNLENGADPTIEVDGESLRFGRRIIFDFGRARIWEPARVHGIRRAAFARLEAVLDAAAFRAPASGLAQIFQPARSRSVPARSPIADGVCDAAAPALHALALWLRDTRLPRRSRNRRPPTAAIDLIGLGPGLTPSGDDFLGGLMIGLRALKRDDLAVRLARLVLPEAGTRTGAISYAHLVCAARGQGGEALHRTIAAIAGSAPLDTGSCLDGIGRMGATSGWDALAGAVMPFRIQLEAAMPAPVFGD